jgi:hypothetical protein
VKRYVALENINHDGVIGARVIAEADTLADLMNGIEDAELKACQAKHAAAHAVRPEIAGTITAELKSSPTSSVASWSIFGPVVAPPKVDDIEPSVLPFVRDETKPA